ncbi:MAG TPA: DUF4235 domain-containing protein [Solirubrobacterales bacterium]|nr:DUF4235 domain-containing protein [Solirubrobacterales bacterium]
MKVLFAPFGIAAGIVAGIAARKGFERIWAAVDDSEPPQPDQRDAPIGKMIAALAVEGAVFRVVKGLADNGSRRGVARLTGRWPGEDSTAE